MNSAAPQLHDYLLDSARRSPDKVALVSGDVRLTYAELDARSNALAHALARRGVVRGDRVLIFAENGAPAVIAFWAALKANAVVSVVNPTTRADKMAYLLEDSRAKALVADGRLAAAFAPAARGSRHLATVIVSGAFDARALDGIPGVVAWRDAVLGEATRSAPRREGIDADLAAIVYTSGSTGDPKGVMLTHRNMITASTSITGYLEASADDVIFSVLPLAFNYGLYQMILAARMGARLVLERGFTYPAEVLSRMAAEKATTFPGVPTIFSMLAELEDLSAWDLSSIRTITNTAAPLTEKHIAVLERSFPNARIYSMYGLTECKRCTYLPPADLHRKPGSVGIPVPNTELWIVGENGERLGPNRVGELVVRGSTVMRGYWEKPEATAEKLRPGPLPGELVLYTGDYCRFDEDGYFYFVGRKDDILKVKGEKVAPREIEIALMDVPGVKEAAVVGVPDELLGQAIKAFVVLERGAALAEGDLRRECQLRLPSLLVPKYIALLPELPKTTTGKIKKTDLAAQQGGE
jgi:amino acid adenylation domain-containing protein